MGYSAADEQFTHQLPRPFAEVHDPDGSWSDRCYFFAHAPNGSMLLTNGYGNNPNQQQALGYGKVACADGRHRDLTVGRRVSGTDRGDLHAGPMRWTCVEPLRRWRCELTPNASGVAWDMEYEPRAPMWELLPMHVVVDGRVILDMFHVKESGRWTGWAEVDGERFSVDGWLGGRDRTFGVRVADEIAFWLWLDAGFAERAVEAWVVEAHDGSVQYVDGGMTHVDGSLSPRFVEIAHEIEFDADRKRPLRAELTFVDEAGGTLRLNADALEPEVGVYYGQPLPGCAFEDRGDGEFLLHVAWDSSDPEQLVAVEERSMAADQLMRFDDGERRGHGILEILSGGEGYERYPSWPPMDMTPFRQHAKER